MEKGGPIRTVKDLAEAAGVTRATIYNWRKSPEYPNNGTLDQQLTFCRAKQLGTAPPAVKAAAASTGSTTHWHIEKAKWDALTKQLAFEAAKQRVIAEARESVVAGVEHVLILMRKKVDARLKEHPQIARELNEIYAEALAELAAIPPD